MNVKYPFTDRRGNSVTHSLLDRQESVPPIESIRIGISVNREYAHSDDGARTRIYVSERINIRRVIALSPGNA